jgi:two-component system, response regulator YesN
MPRLDGLALLDWVRSNRPGMKTLVMTAFSSSSLEQLSLSSGALLFMQKPADPDLIVQALRSDMPNQVNTGGSA